MAYELKNIKVLGYSTDFNQCECCGKTDLKGTISILDLNSDVVLHFGTTCAAKADKYDTFDSYKAAEKEIKAEVNRVTNLKKAAQSFNFTYLRSIYGVKVIDYALILNCNKETIDKCYKQVEKYLITPWNERGKFEFKNE